MTDYLGPAGMFSTDNAAADQNQIDCEQADNLYPEPEPDDNPIVEPLLVSAWCSVTVWCTYTQDYPWNYDQIKADFIAEHDKECRCGEYTNFNIDPRPK